MSDANVIRAEEPTPVQLTRMEGVLNLVAERVVNLSGRVDKHDDEIAAARGDIGELKSATQTLKEQAEADKKTAVALALALKEADETRRTKSESAWSPFTKLAVIVGALGVLWGIFSPMIP